MRVMAAGMKRAGVRVGDRIAGTSNQVLCRRIIIPALGLAMGTFIEQLLSRTQLLVS